MIKIFVTISLLSLFTSIILVAFVRKEVLKLNKPFVIASFILLTFVSASNLLQHWGITSVFDKTEDIMEVLFFPLFIFAVYSGLLKQELNNRIVSDEKFQAIFNQTFTFIGLLDVEGRLLEANETALKFSGVKFENVHRKFFWDTPWWQHSKEEQEQLKTATKLAAQGRRQRLKFSHFDKDNKIHTVDFSISPVKDADGNVVYLLPEGRDITNYEKKQIELQEQKDAYYSLYEEFRQINEELSDAKDRAEESDMLKSAFLTNMSHEIRTPMNGIMGFSQLLTIDGVSKEQKESYIQTINQSCNQLLDIVEDILDVSRIETGQTSASFEKIDVNDILDNLDSKFRYAATAKGLAFEKVVSDIECIETDKDKLVKVLQNLLSNAIKFTEAGYVRYGAEQDTEGIKFYVVDSGIGIPAEIRSKIFDRFWRSELSSVQKFGGTGLGLTISKAFVGMLNGKMVFDSEPGNGTSFYVYLPLCINT